MSEAAATPPPTTQPSRSGRLLDLVRKLIDYGRELAATVRRRVATDPYFATTYFGTRDLTQILALISRGLHRATELEARVLRSAARLDATRKPREARPEAKPQPAQPAEAADVPIVRLPTPKRIAAEVRRRAIGNVLADICRDLGILPSHPLWREVESAIIEYDGNLAGLMVDLLDRTFSPAAPPPAGPPTLRGPTLRFQAPSSTGPP